MEKWAERIAERMKERGVTDAALSAAIKVSQPAVFQWFRSYSGKPTTKMITAENLLAVARYLDLSPEWILHGRGPREVRGKVSTLPEAELRPELVAARQDNDVDALRFAVSALVSTMISHRPAEALAFAEALKSATPAKWHRQGYTAILLAELDRAPKAAEPAPSRRPAKR